MKSGLSPIMIVAAACCWGCMGILVRTLNKAGLSTMEIVALRSFVTFGVMTLGAAIFNRSAFRIRIRDLWCFAGTGILSVVFFNFCYFQTIQVTSLSVAAILLYTSPFFVTLMSAVIFHEKITLRKVICMIVAFFGCILVTGALTGDMNLSLIGVIVGLGAGLGYALYSIFGKLATDKGYSSVTVTLYTFAFASVGVLPFIRASHLTQVYAGNIKEFGIAFLLIIITTVIPYLCYTYGLSGTQPGIAAVLATIEPVAATCVGFLIYREKPSIITIFGIVLVFFAVLFINSKDCTDKNTKKD